MNQSWNTECKLIATEGCALAAIRQTPGIVRADLSRTLGLSRSKAERTADSLVSRGLIQEEQESTGRQGRGGIGLFPATHGAVAIGIAMGETEIVVVGLNLSGDVLMRHSLAVSPAESKRSLLEKIIAGIRNTAGDLGKQGCQLIGIGVADPGQVDASTGVVLESLSFPQWRDVPVAAELSGTFNLPVFVREVNAMSCVYESRYGRAQGYSDFLYVNLSDGVGLGMYLRGELYAGGLGQGGEFGHMRILPDGPVCSCGATGCLEAVAGGKAMVAEAQAALIRGAAGPLRSLQESGASLGAAQILEAAGAGDRLSTGIVGRARQALARAIGSLCTVLNPQLVILGGLLEQYPAAWCGIEDEIRSSILPVFAEKTEILRGAGAVDSPACGAAELVIQQWLADNSRLVSEEY